VATLARGLKISPRSVQRGLRELEGEGLIVGEARSGRPAYYRATVAGVSAAEALRNDSLGEGVSASTGGSDHQTHEVVKEIEKPLSNLSMNPGLIDRVLEERPGLRNWVLSGEGYQLADNAGVFREVARQKFDLQDAVIEELRLRALARADQQSGHR
jgi:DNA-binding PadR family transcriptional regulator